MQFGDVVNGCFETGGAIVVWINVRRLFRDKKVMGVFWPVWIFYSIWGMWNLWYYPSLNQMFSFAGGIALVLGNTFWVWLAFYYEVLLKRK